MNCKHCGAALLHSNDDGEDLCDVCTDTRNKRELSFDTLMGMEITEAYDNCKENGYFEPVEQLHNCTAEDFAADMIAYDGLDCHTLERWGDDVCRAFIIKYAQQYLGMK